MPQRIYLDTDVVSALAKKDMPEETMSALGQVLRVSDEGKLDLFTSELTRREIRKLDDVPNMERDKWNLGAVYRLLNKVDFSEDHTLLGFNNQWGSWGGISSPLIEDDKISSALRQIGLDRTDAHHLMLAINAPCDVFLTCDKNTIVNRRLEIENQFTIRVRTPLEFGVEVEKMFEK